MNRLSSVVVFAVLATWFGSPGAPGAQGSGHLFVLFIDDLHLEFRSTPRLRELMVRRILPVLMRGQQSVAVVTTGYSSISIAPTTEVEVALSGIRRITGGGLRPDEILAPRGPDEGLHRARIAIATARQTIEALATRATGRKVVVIYLSGGYGEASAATDLAELASTANRVNATVHAFESRGLVGGPSPAPSPANESAWLAYYSEAQNSLRAIAFATGGQMVSSPSEVDVAMERLTTSP
jgi:hypothetical protein